MNILTISAASAIKNHYSLYSPCCEPYFSLRIGASVNLNFRSKDVQGFSGLTTRILASFVILFSQKKNKEQAC